MTRTEFILEFDRLSGDVDRGPKSISQCREVEHVTLENAGDGYEASFCTYINGGDAGLFTGWEGEE